MSTSAQKPAQRPASGSRTLTLVVAIGCVLAGIALWLTGGSGGADEGAHPAARAPSASTPPSFTTPPPQAALAGGDACTRCRADRCERDKYVAKCESVLGTATAGASKGKTKANLCAAVVACVREHKCAKGNDVQPCYCGAVEDAACLSGHAQGPCKNVIEQAAESALPEMLAQRWAEPAFAIAQAVNQLRCETACGAVCGGR